MSLILPKINSNQLFTPSILIFLLAICYQFSSLDLVEKTYLYSYILTASIIIMCLKIFIITFGNIENHLKTKKPYFVGTDLILSGCQLIMGFLAVEHLTIDKYPQTTFGWLVLSNIIFCLQIFLGRIPKIINFGLISVAIYITSFFALYFKLFEKSPENFLFMQQSVSYLAIILELIMFFVVTNFFVKKST
jgi:hypothetical protein